MSKLETNQVDPSTGTTLTLGTSGDTIAIPSGVTIANSGTATGFGVTNKPAFYGDLNGSQTISRGAYVKVAGMTDHEVDTNTAFDGTTFTVPSGEGGTYFLYGSIRADYETAGDDAKQARCYLYKNGSEFIQSQWQITGTYTGRYVSLNVVTLTALSAGNTIELYTLLEDNSGANARLLTGTSIGGYKLF